MADGASVPGWPDPIMARRYLEAIGFWPACDGLEIRIIPEGGVRGQAISLWPKPGEKFWQRLVEKNAEGYGVFVGVARRVGERGDAEHVTECSTLFVDIDGKAFDKANPARGKELAWERLTQALPAHLQPPVVVDSGHGYHCYWPLVEPWRFSGPAEKEQFEARLRSIAVYLGGDIASSDVARILRLPGLYNCKQDKVPCILKRCEPGHVVQAADFDDWVGIPDLPGAGNGQAKPVLTVDEIRDRVGRNNALTSLAGSLRRRGVNDEVILTALRAQNERFSPPLDDREVVQIAASVTRYEPERPLVAAPRPVRGDVGLHNDDLERLFLASLLLCSDVARLKALCTMVAPDDFHDPGCAIAYGVILDMVKQGLVVDVPSVQAGLRRKGEIAVALSFGEWVRIDDANPVGLESYATLLVEMANARRLSDAAQEMAAAAKAMSFEQATEYSINLLQDLATKRNLQERGDLVDAIRKADERQVRGITTGLDAYDNWCGGYWPGAYHTVGAYRGTGKTGFMLGRAYDCCAAGARVAYFSNETPVGILIQRLRGYIARVDWRLLEATRSEDAPRWKAKQEATEKLLALRGRLWLFDRQISIAAIRMMVLLKEPEVVFVDYLQHIQGVGGEREYDRITEVSLGLQTMANQEGICVVVASQIPVAQASMGYETEVVEFKGSGSIVADSTIALLLQRDKKRDAQKMRIHVVKNQVGPDGLHFDYRYDETTARLAPMASAEEMRGQRWWLKNGE